MAVTTAVLSGNIADLGLDIATNYLSRVVLVIESNTPGSLLRDTAGDTLLAGAKRVTVDKSTGAYSQTLVRTNSADILPADDRLYQATLIYPSGRPGAGNVTVQSGWFELTADASLSDAGIWQGIEVTAVSTAVYESISMSVASAAASATTAASSATSAAASASVAQTLVTSDLGTTDGQTFALLTDHNSQSAGAVEPVFNIRRFGAAVGNTAAANQTAIQAALDYVGTAGGGTVYVPPGTFLHNDAFTIPSNVHLRGSGIFSILKATALASGGTGVGHRQLDATSKTGFRIADLMLDASEMTVFTSGMRSILCQSSTDYSIERVHFRTPGAAVASIACSKYTIDRPVVTVAATDGVGHHDGIIDQWAGSNNFKIVEPTIYGGGIAKYGILVTGEDTAGLPAACYNFTISAARVHSCKLVGIWINGREGINHTFTISNALVDGVTDFYGIAISDCYAWTLASPVVKNTGLNGIRVHTETSAGGITGGDDGTISSPVVYNANTAASASAADGAAIAILAGSNGVTLTGERVKGTTHTWAVYFDPTLTDCFHGGGSTQAGTLGKVTNDPNGGTYTPTFTAVANVTTVTGPVTVWTRDGDLVTVRGRVTVTPTAAASTATQVGVSLPIASNLASASTDLFGVGATQFGTVAAISADITNDRAQMQFPAASTAGNIFYYSFTYRVL